MYPRKYAIGSLVLFWLFLSFLTSCSKESNASQTSFEEDVPEDAPINIGKAEIFKKMYANGHFISQISSMTGLSEAECQRMLHFTHHENDPIKK